MLLFNVKDSIVKIFIGADILIDQKNHSILNSSKFYNEPIKKINDKILSYSSNFLSFIWSN